MNIIQGDLSHPAVIELLHEHLEGMARHSPAENVYALDLEGLSSPSVSFWTAWEGAELLGCGALKELNPEHGEIKSMRTANPHLGKGVASQLLMHIIDESRLRSYLHLSLETGSGDAFTPAHLLYEKFGFTYCGPFGGYQENSFSRFMTLRLG